jgi:uncharacterized protein (DUF1330 family)
MPYSQGLPSDNSEKISFTSERHHLEKIAGRYDRSFLTTQHEFLAKTMPAYAVAHLREVAMGPAIVEYLQRIDATLEPFGGRFIVEVWEGAWPGHLIIIEFPDRERARAWYESSAYQEILPLRTNNSEGDVVVAEGVSEGHRATDVLGQ